MQKNLWNKRNKLSHFNLNNHLFLNKKKETFTKTIKIKLKNK